MNSAIDKLWGKSKEWDDVMRSAWMVGLGFLAISNEFAAAGSMQLPPDRRWLTVASSQDLDTAIGIAEYYSEAEAKVVSSSNGWYAVIMGPYDQKSVKAALEAHPEIGDVPKDARMSEGKNYIDTAWDPVVASTGDLIEYSIGTSAKMNDGAIDFDVSMSGDEDTPGPTVATGVRGAEKVFSFTTDAEYLVVGAGAGLYPLDPASGTQLVFTRYTGGAHCCTRTWIATQVKGQTGWSLVDAGLLDGDGGYRFRDLDGDGAMEMISVDNAFLYAFDSYAGSFPPLVIEQLRGGKIVNVTDNPAFRQELKRQMARFEFISKLDPSVWKQNGFLVGWLGLKLRLGQGEDAWQVVAENVNPWSDFGPQQCTSGKTIENCDAADLKPVPVLKAIAQFFREREYGPLPQGAEKALQGG